MTDEIKKKIEEMIDPEDYPENYDLVCRIFAQLLKEDEDD